MRDEATPLCGKHRGTTLGAVRDISIAPKSFDMIGSLEGAMQEMSGKGGGLSPQLSAFPPPVRSSGSLLGRKLEQGR
jgi:hypothetical protein